MDDIYNVKRRHAMEFLRLPGVSAFGVECTSEGQYYLAVHLAADDPLLKGQLPSSLEGYPVRLIQTGEFNSF